MIDIVTIRRKVNKDEYAFVGHAIVEGRKDGITPRDVRHVLLSGEIIEEYPERCRCLVLGYTDDGIPVHVTLEFCDWLEAPDQDIVVVTVYVPDKARWLRNRKRKRA
jgi:hypothetical protein